MLGFSIGMVSLILVAGTAIFAMTTLRDTQVDIQEIQLNNVIDYQGLDANLSRNRVLLYRMMRSRDQDEREKLGREIAKASTENDAIMARLAERVMHDALPQGKFVSLKAARDAFNQVRDTRIIPAIVTGRQAEAELAFDAGSERYRDVSILAADLTELAKDYVRRAVEDSISLVRRAVLILGAIALTAVLLSLLGIVVLHRAIALPITGVAEAATQIGAGELDLSTPGEDRQDEVGTLAQAFNRMTASLRNLADIADHIADGDLTDQVAPRSKRDRLAISFDIMSENLKGLTGEMKAGAREVNAVAMEILEITREFVVEIVDPERAGRFQNALLRLEEVSKRLSTVVGQIKLPAGR